MKSREFRLDRRNGKLMGLFAGLANYTGLNANILRAAFVVLTLIAGTWLIAVYFGAWFAAAMSAKKCHRGDDVPPARGSIHELRNGMTDADRRLAEIERYVASPNIRLSREIDSLR